MSLSSAFLVIAVLLAVASIPFVEASVGWEYCKEQFVSYDDLPYSPPDAVKICRSNVLAISYDVKMINPAFSAYYITGPDTDKNIAGRLSFYQDPDLKSLNIKQPSTSCKAFNSTYNKGHLAPSRIMSFSEAGKKSTYTMANVSPQQYYFNQNPWRILEEAIFDWINYNQAALHLVTGVAYKSRSNPQRSWDDVAVPDYFWVVFCDKNAKKSAGFVATNKDYSEGSSTFLTVKEVEDIYGGQLLPYDTCKTHDLDKSHWWSFDGDAIPAGGGGEGKLSFKKNRAKGYILHRPYGSSSSSSVVMPGGLNKNLQHIGEESARLRKLKKMAKRRSD